MWYNQIKMFHLIILVQIQTVIFNASTSFTEVHKNQSIIDKRYRYYRHSPPGTDSSAMKLSISSCALSKEDKVLNFVNQSSDKFINGTSPNLLFEIKRLREKIQIKVKLEILT